MHFFQLGFRRITANVLAVFVLLTFTATLYAQPAQFERFRQRKEQAIQAEAEREKTKNSAAEPTATSGPPKPAVMNVDVQIVLTRSEHKSFAEAKPNAVFRVSDGEPLWLYVKFKGRLGDYVLPAELAEDGTARYQLFAEIAPQGDITALNRYVIIFRQEDLAATELKINLAPGLRGRNAAIPVFLDRASVANRGVWQNEFRLSNSDATPRSLTMNLATTGLTFDLAKGNSAYKMLGAALESVFIRGTSDAKQAPKPASFFSLTLKEKAVDAIRKEGIEPLRFYFTTDEWQESTSGGAVPVRSKNANAAFIYRSGDNCFYGMVKIERQFDFETSKFVEPQVKIEKGFAVSCVELN